MVISISSGLSAIIFLSTLYSRPPCQISGATTHFVDEQVDHGGVIMQRSVPVLEDDTPDTLAARVLTVEHEILPESVRLFCDGKLGVDGRRVHVL